MVVTLCLLIAVQTSNSQQSNREFGVKDKDLTAFDAKTWILPYWYIGCLIGNNRFGEYDGSYDGENCILVHPRYLSGLSNCAARIELKKQAIIIDLKIPAPLFDIVGLNVDQKSNGHLFRIHCTKQLPDFESWFNPIGDDTWLYITFADAQADVAVLQDFKLTAFVKKILVIQSATSVQFTFMLKGHVDSASLIPVGESHDIYVAIFMPTEEQLAIRKAR